MKPKTGDKKPKKLCNGRENCEHFSIGGFMYKCMHAGPVQKPEYKFVCTREEMKK